ncbi:aromatic-L-amino-acid decarboxylase-like [Mya arenaria]|uniref:aromatic-L-amino-acid decarboxylase-like n=1 Tax=Mya arenaria TaxID=6604 RepID=UPI0022DF5187|nr:aromatic-L-amino-acid decarboxylase-like [Mya arenaria]
MDEDEFNVRAKEALDMVFDYTKNARDYNPLHDVKQGYLSDHIPLDPPTVPEKWEDIVTDFDRYIFPGSLCPAGVELEVIVMDWLAKMIGLPDHFLYYNNSDFKYGGGCLQNTTCESTLVALLSARKKALLIRRNSECAEVDDWMIMSKFVAYSSEEVMATLGTSFLCVFDDTHELGQVCKSKIIWLHVDAALAGSMFICPEKRRKLKGIELCSLLDRTCKYHALKVWFVIRCYGRNGLQDEIRKDINFALYFKDLLTMDSRFEILNDVCTSIVCFRLKAPNTVNKALYQDIFYNKKQIHISKADSKGTFFLRFVSRSSNLTTREDIDFAWNIIQTTAENAFKKITC